MSTENPFLPNFDGLAELEALAGRLRLDVRTNLADAADQLEPGALIRLPAHDFRRIGLTLRSDWSADEVEAAIRAARLKPELVYVVITAEDGFLKERTPVGLPVAAAAMPNETRLIDYGGGRLVAMKNSHRGFTLDVHVILIDDIEPLARRPHRKGTILARSTFKVLPNRDTGGLDPKPLTEDRITEFDLTKNTVLYVHCDDDMVTLEHLDSNLEIYVHEQLLAAASHQRGVDRDAMIGGLAIEALCQLVHVVSAELKQGIVPLEGDRSAVLRLLRRNLKAAGLDVPREQLTALLRDQPGRVSGVLSGLDKRAQRLLHVVAGDEEQSSNDGETEP